MLIGIINGNDIRVGDYKVLFPNTSFPASGPSDSFLARNNAKKVSVFKDHNRANQKLIPATPYIDGDYIYTVSVANKSEEEIAADTASRAANIRASRDRLLAASDWTQLPDSPLSSEKKAEWATYRTLLRNLPDTEGFPDITLPNDPDYVEPEEGTP